MPERGWAPEEYKQGLNTVPSVPERAIRMEMADKEAGVKENKYGQEAAGQLTTRVKDKLQKLFGKDQNQPQPTAAERLTTEVANRIFGHLITEIEGINNVKALEQMKEEPNKYLTNQPYPEANAEVMQKAVAMVTEKANAKIESLKEQLAKPFIEEIKQAKTTLQLDRPFGYKAESASKDLALQANIKKALSEPAKAMNFSDEALTQVAEKVFAAYTAQQPLVL
jgi:hypothetical protein